MTPGKNEKNEVKAAKKGPEAGSKIKKKKSSLIAFVLSLVPGLGLVYTGLPVHGLVVLLTSILVLPYLYSILFTLKAAGRLNRGEPYGEKVGLFFSIVLGLVLVLTLNFFILPKTGMTFKKLASLAAGKKPARKAAAPAVKQAGQAAPAVTPAPAIAGLTQLAAQPEKVAASTQAAPAEAVIPEPKDYFEDGIPLYPGSEITGMVVRENFTAYKFTVMAPVGSVSGFYRKYFALAGCELKTYDYKEGQGAAKISYGSARAIKCEIEISTKSPAGISAGVISITKK